MSGTVDAGAIPAHGSVMLKVSSPASLITGQKTLVGDLGSGSFADQLQDARDAVTAGRTADARDALDGYVRHVRVGRQVGTDLAERLVDDAEKIRALLGC